MILHVPINEPLPTTVTSSGNSSEVALQDVPLSSVDEMFDDNEVRASFACERESYLISEGELKKSGSGLNLTTYLPTIQEQVPSPDALTEEPFAPVDVAPLSTEEITIAPSTVKDTENREPERVLSDDIENETNMDEEEELQEQLRLRESIERAMLLTTPPPPALEAIKKLPSIPVNAIDMLPAPPVVSPPVKSKLSSFGLSKDVTLVEETAVTTKSKNYKRLILDISCFSNEYIIEKLHCTKANTSLKEMCRFVGGQYYEGNHYFRYNMNSFVSNSGNKHRYMHPNNNIHQTTRVPPLLRIIRPVASLQLLYPVTISTSNNNVPVYSTEEELHELHHPVDGILKPFPLNSPLVFLQGIVQRLNIAVGSNTDVIKNGKCYFTK